MNEMIKSFLPKLDSNFNGSLHSFCRMSPIMSTAGKNKIERKTRGKQTVTLLSFGLELCVPPKSWCTCNE
jgi:hypothetical protein